MRVLTADTGKEPGDSQSAKVVGPTFKVKVDIEGVKTRALLDNGMQVTLVQGELLAKIRVHNNWTLEQSQQEPPDGCLTNRSFWPTAGSNISCYSPDEVGLYRTSCNDPKFCSHV